MRQRLNKHRSIISVRQSPSSRPIKQSPNKMNQKLVPCTLHILKRSPVLFSPKNPHQTKWNQIVSSSLSSISSVFEVSFSFLVTMGDGTLPKQYTQVINQTILKIRAIEFLLNVRRTFSQPIPPIKQKIFHKKMLIMLVLCLKVFKKKNLFGV